jgi:hypothetical protein
MYVELHLEQSQLVGSKCTIGLQAGSTIGHLHIWIMKQRGQARRSVCGGSRYPFPKFTLVRAVYVVRQPAPKALATASVDRGLWSPRNNENCACKRTFMHQLILSAMSSIARGQITWGRTSRNGFTVFDGQVGPVACHRSWYHHHPREAR